MFTEPTGDDDHSFDWWLSTSFFLSLVLWARNRWTKSSSNLAMDGDDSFLVCSSNAFIDRKLCIIPSKIGEHTTQGKHDFFFTWSLINLMIHKHRCLESEIDAQGHWENHRQPFATLPFKSAYSSSLYFDQCNIVE